MGWDSLRQSIRDFDDVMAHLGLSIPSGSPVEGQMALMRDFLATQSRGAAATAGLTADFYRFYHAAIVSSRLTDAVAVLRDQPSHLLRAVLKKVLPGPLTQDFVPSQAKDYLYELEMAALFCRAGFDVTLREPDVLISGSGLSQPMGMACKNPSSSAQIHAHLSKGYRQITHQNVSGFVAIGIDLLAFTSMPKFLDFNQGGLDPITVVQGTLDQTMISLVVERDRDYPGEKPLDGAIVSLMPWGTYGKPAGFTSVRGFTLQCDASNPIFGDLAIITSKLKALKMT